MIDSHANQIIKLASKKVFTNMRHVFATATQHKVLQNRVPQKRTRA